MEQSDHLMHKIILADDDKDILQLVKMRLESNGFVVKLAPNGENLSALTRSEKPDAILLDLNMEGVSGYNLCIQLKMVKETENIPVILFSADDNLGKTARMCGADDYISKPFTLSEMLYKLNRVIYRLSA